MQWWQIVLLVLIVPAYKFLINVILYRRVDHYERVYTAFFTDYAAAQNNPEYQPMIVDLMHKAGVSSPSFSAVQPVDFTHFEYNRASVFNNMFSTNPEVNGLMRVCFQRARGVFKKRAVEAINPLFWVDFVLHLPAHALQYLGIKPDSVSSKILNIVYWMLLAAFAVFRSQAMAWLKALVGNIGP